MSQDHDEEVICPIVEAINAVGTEARLLVLRYLFDGDKGFNELLRLTKLSSKTLSTTLKYLEEKKIIKRNVVSTRPFKVMYSLTEKGKDLKPVFDDLRKWGQKWMDSLLD
ncbi:ArsR family transcriptional regulator [Acidianus sulfidivorans JP7]|uniref:Transcriptional regulator n=1 Tax=Acidianus sulfidivorans JP7 TaxID=619593 RepID=A0A2U9IL68_9CREN|nr:ArsR family transcriptional regulator [Acidianus sulfidivorans JP7]